MVMAITKQVSVAPDIETCDESELEVLIIIDLSASMSKAGALDDAKAAALACIDRLPRSAGRGHGVGGARVWADKRAANGAVPQ